MMGMSADDILEQLSQVRNEMCLPVSPVSEADDKGKESGANKESVKGSLESLAKRMSGLGSLIDSDKMPEAAVALGEIIKGAQALLEKMGTKKGQEKPSNEPEKDTGGKEAPEPAGKEKEGEKEQGGGQGAEAGQGGGQQGQGGGEKKEDIMQVGPVIHSGLIIRNAKGGDPFGMGGGFLTEMRERVTGKKVR